MTTAEQRNVWGALCCRAIALDIRRPNREAANRPRRAVTDSRAGNKCPVKAPWAFLDGYFEGRRALAAHLCAFRTWRRPFQPVPGVSLFSKAHLARPLGSAFLMFHEIS